MANGSIYLRNPGGRRRAGRRPAAAQAAGFPGRAAHPGLGGVGFRGYALACWGVLYGLYTQVIRAFAPWDLLPVCLLLEAGAEWLLAPASRRSAGEGPRLRLWAQALAAACYLLLRLVLL